MSLLLAVQRQVAFIALVHVHAGYIVQRSPVLDNILGRSVGTLVDTEHNRFFRLHRYPVYLIVGKLPEIRPHGHNRNSFLFAIPVFVGNVLHAHDFNFLVFQLYSGFPLYSYCVFVIMLIQFSHSSQAKPPRVIYALFR